MRFLCDIVSRTDANAVVWIVSIFPFIFSFHCVIFSTLGIIVGSPTTICITITSMFHSLSALRQSLLTYLPDCFLLFSLCCPPDLFFFVISVLVRIGWSVYISKFQIISSISFSFRANSGLSIYHSSAESNFSLLHNSQRIIFPTHLYLLLHSFCVSLLHFCNVIISFHHKIASIKYLQNLWFAAAVLLKEMDLKIPW